MVRKPWQQQYLHDIFQDKCFSLPFSSPRFCQLLEACFVKWISGSEKLLWFERASITVWSLPAFVTKACLNPSGLIFFLFYAKKSCHISSCSALWWLWPCGRTGEYLGSRRTQTLIHTVSTWNVQLGFQKVTLCVFTTQCFNTGSKVRKRHWMLEDFFFAFLATDIQSEHF